MKKLSIRIDNIISVGSILSIDVYINELKCYTFKKNPNIGCAIIVNKTDDVKTNLQIFDYILQLEEYLDTLPLSVKIIKGKEHPYRVTMEIFTIELLEIAYFGHVIYNDDDVVEEIKPIPYTILN